MNRALASTFLIFINDFPKYVKSSLRIFADDAKVIGNGVNIYIIVEDLNRG